MTTKKVLHVSDEAIERLAQRYTEPGSKFAPLPALANAANRQWAHIVEFASDFGWDEAQLRRFLRANGITRYDPAQISDWVTITYLIRATNEALDKAVKGVAGIPQVCPVCGSETERVMKRDGMYGWRYGWRCLVPENDHFSLTHWWKIFHPSTVYYEDFSI